MALADMFWQFWAIIFAGFGRYVLSVLGRYLSLAWAAMFCMPLAAMFCVPVAAMFQVPLAAMFWLSFVLVGRMSGVLKRCDYQLTGCQVKEHDCWFYFVLSGCVFRGIFWRLGLELLDSGAKMKGREHGL